MKVTRTWLQTFFEKDIPTSAELAELFTFHSCEVEGIDESVDGDVLDLKILPDRAHYCLSHRGIAEEVHVITGQPLKAPRDIPPAPAATPSVAVPNISVEAGIFCRRYMGRKIENIAVADSPQWLKNHLEGIGERAINNIVDATNLIMFDVGQPLHAFDADAVKGDIVVRAAKEGEKIILITGKSADGKMENREVALTTADHVIADDIGPLAIAGVKGGARAQVTPSTKNIIIESANFNPTSVRQTATRLNLRNESSRRFENEITPELAADGMDYVSGLIGALVPSAASTMSVIVDMYPVKPQQTVISTTAAYIHERLGAEIPEKIFFEILARLGITVAKNADGELTLVIPYHRIDLAIPEDIAEEVGRIYGYEKITTRLSSAGAKEIAVLPSFYLAEKIKNALAADGFSEVDLYTLVPNGVVETAHPLASDKAFARENLADGIFVCLEKNALNADLLGLDAIKVFEFGRTFTKTGESSMLALGVAQVKKVKGLKSETVVAEAVKNLLAHIDIPTSDPSELSKMISKTITKRNSSVLEINLDDLLASYALPANASYADLGFGPATVSAYKKFSAYPFIVRDVAVFTPDNVRAADVWTSISQGIAEAKSEPLLARHSLFDTFKKDGKVSYAFRMVFQSMEETLTDERANAVMQHIYADLKKRGWEVR